MRTVADALWEELAGLGARHVVGVAGTQAISLLEALRGAELAYTGTTSELAAAFLANGYVRAGGAPAVLLTIPGPGFTWALPGLAEACDDSAALIHVLPVREQQRAFALQQLPHGRLGELLSRGVFTVREPGELATAVRAAWKAATAAQPGPALLMIDVAILASPAVRGEPPGSPAVADAPRIPALLTEARRPLLFLGQGAGGAEATVRAFVAERNWPVITTTSGRGIVAESAPQVLPWECIVEGHLDVVNEIVAASDAVLALGCRLGHNGSAGFSLRLPPEKLVRVDTSPEVLAAGYPAAHGIRMEAGAFLARLAAAPLRATHAWESEALAAWRGRLERARRAALPLQSALVAGGERVPMPEFFAALRETLAPRDVLVTDSGNHQNYARAFYRVERARTLVCPIDFQSMGFAIPAAEGARLACPDRRVAALLGDGGFCMSGLELVTAMRELLDLTVIVFNDRRLAMIGDHQLERYGRTFGVAVAAPDLAHFARAVGASHVRLGPRWRSELRAAHEAAGIAIVEAVVEPTAELRNRARKAAVKRMLRNLVPRRGDVH